MKLDIDKAEDGLFKAAVALVGRTGAKNLHIGYVDERKPPVWYAMADYATGHEAAGAMTPLRAVLRLLDVLIDGGICAHCNRPTGVEVAQGPLPLDAMLCWYQYDPELRTFRRSCE